MGPAEPAYRVGLVECYNRNSAMGGSDKLKNKHRFDSIPIANGLIKQGMSCQIINYVHEEHDKYMEVAKQFDAIVWRCIPGDIDADGGSQQKADKDMQELAKTIPVWPTADVMTLMGAKDALVKIKDTDFGLVDTLGYYSPEDMKAGFPKAIAFQPRVVKQNRGSAGEGIWIIKLKDEKYCDNYCDEIAAGDEVLILKEANDYNVEHYLYIGGVSGETKTTVYTAEASEYAATRKKLEEGVPDYMKCLGLDMAQLPLLWAADFLVMEDGSHKIGEFNCSCLGVTGFLDARGKDGPGDCKPEDVERGQAMCDHIGVVAKKAFDARQK